MADPDDILEDGVIDPDDLTEKDNVPEEAQAEDKLKKLVELAKLPDAKKMVAGRPPKGKYNKDLTLTDDDMQIIKMLTASGNKKLVARINAVDRKQIYRLMTSNRIKKITANAENRLQALLEACVILVESAVIEDGDLATAKEILKNFGLLKPQQAEGGSNAARKRTTLEEVMEPNGTHTRRAIQEEE